MANALIFLSMIGLLALCGLMTIIILMQKPSANAGMGAALGGGAAESVFGGETANVLLKYTVRLSVAFYAVSFLLYMGILAHNNPTAAAAPLPGVLANLPPTAPATPPPATGKNTSAGASGSAAAAVPGIATTVSATSAKAAPTPATSTPASSASAK